jgi:hypothetical protein
MVNIPSTGGLVSYLLINNAFILDVFGELKRVGKGEKRWHGRYKYYGLVWVCLVL